MQSWAVSGARKYRHEVLPQSALALLGHVEATVVFLGCPGRSGMQNSWLHLSHTLEEAGCLHPLVLVRVSLSPPPCMGCSRAGCSWQRLAHQGLFLTRSLFAFPVGTCGVGVNGGSAHRLAVLKPGNTRISQKTTQTQSDGNLIPAPDFSVN